MQERALAVDANCERFYDSLESALSSMSVAVTHFKRLQDQLLSSEDKNVELLF